MSKYDKLVTNAAGRVVPTIINGTNTRVTADSFQLSANIRTMNT